MTAGYRKIQVRRTATTTNVRISALRNILIPVAHNVGLPESNLSQMLFYRRLSINGSLDGIDGLEAIRADRTGYRTPNSPADQLLKMVLTLSTDSLLNRVLSRL
jgi:hypothetical protein